MDGADLHYGSSSDRAPAHQFDAPVLVIGDSNRARERAAELVSAAGLRIGARIDVADALDRLAMQAQLKAVCCEFDREPGSELPTLLDELDHLAAGGVPVVVSATADHLDLVAARIHEPSVELLIDASAAERVAALATATRSSARDDRVHDSSRDSGSDRLRQLSEEVSRIASTLARLSSEPVGERNAPVQAPVATATAELSAETVRSVIRSRRLRSKYFEEDLFADPAWDMLLDLMQAEIAQHRVPVSSLCAAAAVPATTALRWIKTLVERGLFVRRPDAHDGRRIFIELAPGASTALRGYFAELGRFAVV